MQKLMRIFLSDVMLLNLEEQSIDQSVLRILASLCLLENLPEVGGVPDFYIVVLIVAYALCTQLKVPAAEVALELLESLKSLEQKVNTFFVRNLLHLSQSSDSLGHYSDRRSVDAQTRLLRTYMQYLNQTATANSHPFRCFQFEINQIFWGWQKNSVLLDNLASASVSEESEGGARYQSLPVGRRIDALSLQFGTHYDEILRINQQYKDMEPPLKRRNSSSTRKFSIIRGSATNLGEYVRPDFTASTSSFEPAQNGKIWKIMSQYEANDLQTIERSIVRHIQCTLARTRFDFKEIHCYQAVAHSRFNDTNMIFNQNPQLKRVAYLSLQFLMGRALQNALVNISLQQNYKQAIAQLGYVIQKIYQEEVDPALGNGGLGRLAACFLDSLATLNYPAWGYGLRYQYGIFRQIIRDGYQVQIPDSWLSSTNPWEIQRQDVQYPVRFYGSTRMVVEGKHQYHVWEGGQIVIARAFDTPIPGYNTDNTIALRLWKSLPAKQFDFTSFNTGDYFKALEERQKASYITSVLYPNDSTYQGKQLRLKQEYLLVSATVQDILRRYKKSCKKVQWSSFPKHCMMQLNDTHPILAIVQLLRLLVDVQKLDDQSAWDIVTQSFGYTNHTVLPQALEMWSVDLLGRLLPRHLQIIYLINHLWLQKVSKRFPGDSQKLRNLSIVQEDPKKIRMAHLGIVTAKVVNGVAKIHSDLLKTDLFRDFYSVFPNKFLNMTNGVTPRRWLLCANPGAASLLTLYLTNDDWTRNLYKLKELQYLAQDADFQQKWHSVKLQNKLKLINYVRKHTGVELDINSLFDIHIKRIHQYKRQLMNILYNIHRYLQLKAMTPQQRKSQVPRSVIFGGKAAPGYMTAKKIIKLINCVAQVVNNDFQTRNYLKVVYIPNYGVSNAQIIIPASELSHHISTAGLQASGTSNMKFIINGCVLIGTLDGANVQIIEEVGQQNFFLFGAKIQEIESLRAKMSSVAPEEYWGPELTKAIQEGRFGSRQVLTELIDTIRWKNDYYLVCADFNEFMLAQQRVDSTYSDRHKWQKMSILNCLRSGKFSSDRTIMEYAKSIWEIKQTKAHAFQLQN